MATTTPNLGLVKPDYEDLADIAVLNENSDTIDAAVKAVQDSVSKITWNSVESMEVYSTQTQFGLRPVIGGVMYGISFNRTTGEIAFWSKESGSWVKVWSK